MVSATMTASPPYQGSTPMATSTASQPRKRRRRAPAAGAADDCFTCSSLGIVCDRKRPYCSQCLGDGKDCAGYKTTLTWGVGVASRGKLRGLSLPVAGTAKAIPQPSPSPRKRSASKIDADAPKAKRASTATSTVSSTASQNKRSQAQTPGDESGRKSYLSSPGTSSWQNPPIPPSSVPPHMSTLIPERQMHPQDVHPISIPMVSSYADPSIPSSASSTGGFTNYSFPSPVMYSASSEDSNYPMLQTASHKSPMSLAHIVPNFDQSSQNGWGQSEIINVTAPPMSTTDFLGAAAAGSGIYDHDHHATFGNPQHVGAEHDTEEGIETTIYGNGIRLQNAGHTRHYEPTFLEDSFSDNSMMLSPYANIAIGKTPRMQYLINYYTEVISPVIVAFDGPNNPYRTHILRLAMNSETLQHAIAALSASNLRQRRENNVLVSTGKTLPARRASMAHSALTDESWLSGVAIISPEDQAREELLHKTISIQSLNNALADPIRRKDDSILATLLILCLFHICDSGVAKFQTQFAGVKKLLGLRSADNAMSNMNASSILSKETSWYTRMFTWFDAFTATVNDREGQLQGNHLDISSQSDEEWALENLAGCDGRLFKIIAKLGRLHVLSRNGKVEPQAKSTHKSPNYTQPYSHFDGNGWTSLNSSAPSATMFGLPTSIDVPIGNDVLFDADSGPQDPEDTRSPQFWSEWNATRSALLSWQLSATSPVFSTSTPSATIPLSLTLEQKADLVNISESFRYSAVLYLERLAYPLVPSSDPRIQVWVSRSLNYIRLVKSDVYLLWPLFITGSECVTSEDRQVVRQRCLDIQKDSGFMNNWSTLELLEKVWSRSPAEDIRRSSAVADGSSAMNRAAKSTSPSSTSSDKGDTRPMTLGQEDGFRWRKVMQLEKNEGEYIVV